MQKMRREKYRSTAYYTGNLPVNSNEPSAFLRHSSIYSTGATNNNHTSKANTRASRHKSHEHMSHRSNSQNHSGMNTHQKIGVACMATCATFFAAVGTAALAGIVFSATAVTILTIAAYVALTAGTFGFITYRRGSRYQTMDDSHHTQDFEKSEAYSPYSYR